MEQMVKKKIGVRDIMTIAAMMVINFAIAMVIGMVTLPFPAAVSYTHLCQISPGGIHRSSGTKTESLICI